MLRMRQQERAWSVNAWPSEIFLSLPTHPLRIASNWVPVITEVWGEYEHNRQSHRDTETVGQLATLQEFSILRLVQGVIVQGSIRKSKACKNFVTSSK